MKIEIKNRFSGEAIFSGDYEGIRDCLEQNPGANLYGANLECADLGGADLGGANLDSAYLRSADLRGANLCDANLCDAYLCDANLDDANLCDANLDGANLCDANLDGANMEGARGYSRSRDIFEEAVRRQPVSLFVDAEWIAIAQITIHRLCWDAIKKRFCSVMPSIFTKLSDAGFPEWLKYWNEEVSK